MSSDDPAGLALVRRARPGRHGYRRRRIRLHPRRFPPLARRAGRRAAGRCHPLRRGHRLSRRPPPCANRIISISRAIARRRSTCMSPRRAPSAPSGMVSRPCAHRAHAVRRRTGPRGGAIAPDRAARVSASSSRKPTPSVSGCGDDGDGPHCGGLGGSAGGGWLGPVLAQARRAGRDDPAGRQVVPEAGKRAAGGLDRARRCSPRRRWPTARSSIIAARFTTRPCMRHSPCRA